MGQDRGENFWHWYFMARPDFRTPRLFLDTELHAGAGIPLEREHFNYLVNVLRLNVGEPVLVFNGRSGEWRAHLASASKRSATLTVEKQTRPQPERSDLEYAFAPLKHARLDYMVQKAVELGASKLQPVITQHTQVARVNSERMRANAIEAAEQCGVLTMAEICEPLPLDRWLDELQQKRPLIFCDENTDVASPVEALNAARGKSASVLIGPEGGFSEEERKTISFRENVITLSLGPRILRADTAGVAALALIQAVLGDWRKR